MAELFVGAFLLQSFKESTDTAGGQHVGEWLPACSSIALSMLARCRVMRRQAPVLTTVCISDAQRCSVWHVLIFPYTLHFFCVAN